MATQRYFIFTPKIGEDEPILTHIFSDGLKQPTRNGLQRKSGGSKQFLQNICLKDPWNQCYIYLLFFDINQPNLGNPYRNYDVGTPQKSQGKWWYAWDGTLNNQPYIHLISRGYLLGPNPLLKVFGMFFSQSPLGPPC